MSTITLGPVYIEGKCGKYGKASETTQHQQTHRARGVALPGEISMVIMNDCHQDKITDMDREREETTPRVVSELFNRPFHKVKGAVFFWELNILASNRFQDMFEG